MLRSTRTGCAPTRSILFTKIRVGIRSRRSVRIRTWVCACTPSTADTTSTAPSSTLNTRSTSAMKSGWPGVSIRLTVTSSTTKDTTADLIVIPRCRSSARESVWVLPSSTLPISSMTPAAYSSRSVRLVLPASTCAKIPKFNVFTERQVPWVGSDYLLGELRRSAHSALLDSVTVVRSPADPRRTGNRIVVPPGHARRDTVEMAERPSRAVKLRRYWDKQSGSYDKGMTFCDRHFFGDTREWVCSQATGDVLEVAIGTGLNLEHYPTGLRLTGVDYSPAMLDIARRRAADLGREVALHEGDAQALTFPDASYDTVVCTFSLCAIPDERRAVEEMTRVLRPGGLLLLADHVESSRWYARAIQSLLELVTVPLGEEHFRRRPIRHVEALGYAIDEHQRFKLGVVERLAARKPLS